MSIDLKKISDQFLLTVTEDCRKHGVSLLIVPQPITSDGCKTNGFFDASLEDPKLVLKDSVIDGDLGLAVHEYCHMQQWLEDKEAFVSTDEFERIEEWLYGKNIEHLKVMKYIDKSFEVEADCEQRSVEMLKNLGVDNSYINRYIQKANAYLAFYHVVRVVRKWYQPGKAPYEIAQIVDAMPITKIISPGDASRLMSRSDIPWWMCFGED